jgi:hypothetical protein
MNRREFVIRTLAVAAVANSRPARSEPPPPTDGPHGTGRVVPLRSSRSTGFWTDYPSDDFDEPYLKRRWYIRDTDVEVSGGRVSLTNPNSTNGSITLKGCFDNRTASGEGGRPKLYLSWPWAMETEMLVSALLTSETPFCGGMRVTLCNPGGMQATVEIGRAGGFGANWAFYRIDHNREDAWTTEPSINEATRLFMRIEGLGDDRRSVRCGIKAREHHEWHWSTTLQLPEEVRWAENAGLFNSRTAGIKNLESTGEPVTISFEYTRFEGDCFSFEKPGPVGFIRSQVDSPGTGEVRGETYAARVPDTLDLAQRCALALNALTECADPTAEYEIYGMVLTSPRGWTTNDMNYYNPAVESRLPVMVHDFGDDLLQSKVVEAIPLMRVASGSRQGLDAGEKMLQWLRRTIGPDGIIYHPIAGRPWALFAFSGRDPFGAEAKSGQLADNVKSEYAGLMPGRLMLALGAWHAATGNDELLNDMNRMADGIAKSAEPWWETSHPIGQGATAQGLAKCFELTGNERARETAARIISHMRQKYYQEDGTFRFNHFHTAVFGLLAMHELAAATDDKELMDFASRAYEYGRGKGASIVGFFPEGVDQRPAICESCETAEMAGLASLLSHAGRDYWDDVDHYVRNQFAENQLMRADWIDQMVASDPHPPSRVFPGDCTRNVARRVVGWFSSYANASNWFVDFPRAPGLVACCLGNGSRSLYYVWENIVTESADVTRVNLLLNRASQSVDVNSHLPYTGRVDIHVKQDRKLLLRIPSWVEKDSVRMNRNGRALQFGWEGRYIAAGPVVTRDIVTVNFPLSEKTTRVQIGEESCRVRMRGSTVIDIEPRGATYPLYQRAAYRSDQTLWKNVERFVPERSVRW